MAKKTPKAAPVVATKPAPAFKPVATTVVAPATKAKPALTHEMIAKRAYQVWERRGKPLGRDVENWKEAERELKAELGLG